MPFQVIFVRNATKNIGNTQPKAAKKGDPKCSEQFGRRKAVIKLRRWKTIVKKITNKIVKIS